MTHLERNGYGNFFNDLIIHENKFIEKRSKNSYGDEKILKEINFFKFIITNNIKFPTPFIYEFFNNGYKMEYINESIPLYKHINKNNCDYFLNKIFNELSNLHQVVHERDVNIYDELKNETIIKILNRNTHINEIVNLNINVVNGTKILSYDDILIKIKRYIKNFKSKRFDLCLIHGDLNFNNILVKDEDIFFIDPKASFGNIELFGIKEYDFAKIKFALSGYDSFDSEQKSEITIINNEICFDMYPICDLDVLIDSSFESFLMMTIWLGNSHCFINNKYKCMKSFYYALYISTLFFNICE